MKKTRKLIPALAMLLISAVMLSTASFAWFSMNATVTASGMQVKATSEQTFLLISVADSDKEKTAAEIRAEAESGEEKGLSVTLREENNEVYPAAIDDNPTPPTNDGNLKFYYAIGKSFTDGAEDTSLSRVTVDKDNGSYIKKYTFYIAIAKGAAAAKNIVVTDMTITASGTGSKGGANAVKAVVATETGLVSKAEDLNETVICNEISGDDVLTVNVYVYYDGTNTDVTTENAPNLQGATVSITFGVKNAGENS